MATREKNQICENLLRKITAGEALDGTEKSHLAVCECCMAEIVRTLDESAAGGPHGLNVAADGATNGDLARARPEAQLALEHGRRVFAREFGISLSEK